MAEKVVGGLKWVKSEIAATLRRVTERVEVYGQTSESGSLGDAVDALFEIRGVLLALQLTLPARLADEMQRLCDAMAEDRVRSPKEAAEAMMLALIQLPNHLDRLDVGVASDPLSLWPTINDLRASRGAPPLTQAELLVPGSVLAEEEEDLPSEALEALTAVFRKVRPHFHRDLVEWYRPATSSEGLIKLGRLFHQLHRFLKDGILADLFRLAEAYAVSMQGGEIAADADAQTLVGRLDRVFKPLVDTPPEWPDAEARQLIDAFLGALSGHSIQTSSVDDIQAHYQRVHGLAADRTHAGNAASDALAGLAQAMLSELTPLKERLDAFVRGGRDDRAPLDEIRTGLRVLARTLDVADTGDLPERLRLLADGFGELVPAETAEEIQRLEALAADLLGIEAVIQAYAEHRDPPTGSVIAPGLYVAELQKATLREARAEFVGVRDAILACRVQGAHPARFREVPECLSRVAGALQILGDDAAAQVATDLAVMVRRRYLAADRWPRDLEFGFLADAIAALELHIERVEEGEPEDHDLIRQSADALRDLDRALGAAPGDADQADTVERIAAAPAPAPALVDSDAVAAVADAGAARPAQATGISPEFLDIFLEEAQEETQAIGERFARWQDNLADESELSALRRSFHTLKGSGRLVGAVRVADLTEAAEGVLNGLLELGLVPDAAGVAWLAEVVEVLPHLVAAEAQQRPLDIAGLVARAAQLGQPSGAGSAALTSPDRQSADAPASAWPESSEVLVPAARPAEARHEGEQEIGSGADVTAAVTQWPTDGLLVESADRWFAAQLDWLNAPPATAPVVAAAAPPEAPQAAAVTAADLTDHASVFVADDELLAIFRAETRGHLDDVRAFLVRAAAGDAVPDEGTVRALHTLSGSARMSGIDSIADVARLLERRLRALQIAAEAATAVTLELIERAVDGIAQRTAELPAIDTGADLLLALAADLTAITVSEGVSAVAWEAPVVPASSLDLDLEGFSLPPLWLPDSAPVVSDDDGKSGPVEAVSVLLDQGRLEPRFIDPAQSDARSVSDPAVAGGVNGGEAAQRDLELVAFLDLSDERALSEEGGSDRSGASGAVRSVDELPKLTPVRAPRPQDPGRVAAESLAAALEAAVDALDAELETVTLPPASELTEGPESVPASQPAGQERTDPPCEPAGEPDDQDLLSLFLEDGRDLLDGIDAKLRSWQLAPQDLGVLDGINRLLHTLKGSARLAGLTPIGDLSHALETRLTAVRVARGQVDDTTLELAQRTVDTLSLQMDALEQHTPLPRAAALVVALNQEPEPVPTGSTDETERAILRSAVSVAADAPASPEVAAAPDLVSAPADGPRDVGGVTVPQVRVRSDLINRLVDAAGEIGLYRARLTQRNGLLSVGLGELDQTVRRLRDQLRQLETETETQIRAHYEREGAVEASGPAFDPLELDRFSTFQQLSRGLAETVNDLVSLRDLLGGYQRESADLLTQQARLASDVQDGLLRTRMVPFVQVVPRLHRLVRQTAESLGKSARLEVIGPEVELDRSILDRLAAPLEHLLRNAVDHGLEAPPGRAAADKPAAGTVTLALSREGNEVVIHLSDDGRGLDLAAIRAQAVARGLLPAQAELEADALMQFVFEPGFTTLGQVTQISGRGVGLDVVASEIKAANGTIDLSSIPGQGARFSIRLPLTLAILDAFLVRVGASVYALPHAAIEGVARIGRDDLAAIYQGRGRDFDYQGHAYRVAYLGRLLDPGLEPRLGEQRWLPLLLARVGDLRVALQVDALIESARILVKPLGARLATVRWLAGGAILPDGRVALILDVLALLRSGAVHDYLPPSQGVAVAALQPVCVMVVDDSLTVRRVTARLLRRQQMEVITANDGVEALTLLDARRPDLILLDIEMPRMDGYELTRHIRRSERLRDLPIIMITSRAGPKHRDHALALGVNRYLSKPFQESELLDEITSLLAEQQR
ncbi:hybrid sensor histidine kinase/response regulator [Lamprocystis purpurea]|jgi:chemosensory pili system protein ChpA (sensor histidine kinase/response regulator)|uniref:hybrid sensor histidine kinase/response regulator n=1 Tax=Lamprocystis purpurea TaxID=61598 RepID=UPI000377D06D|nr:Hpt domain-containing protein [Lamprocystis purpurea]